MIAASMADARGLFERYCRRHAMMIDEGAGIVNCRVLGWADCFVRSDDWGQARWLTQDGYWESWISVVMAHVIRAGDYVIDVGACYGYYTLLAAGQVGDTGRVVACEANPELQPLLRRTIKANQLEGSVQIEPRIVWSRSREERQIRVFDRHNIGGSSVVREGAAAAVYTIPTVTIDDMCRDWPRVDAIKIDAEGAEHEIWHGMRDTVARYKPTIVMEFNRDYEDPAGFLAEIRGAGYRISMITTAGDAQEITDAEILAQPKLIYLLLQAETDV